MKRVHKGAQMSPQKAERHFDRQKLVLLIRLACCGQDFITTPIKSDRKRSEFGFAIIKSDAAVAFPKRMNEQELRVDPRDPLTYFIKREAGTRR